ncbi:MAG: DegT/DnrJ/EryC1/StrS family aminotransferase [Bacteroidales bacterium]
MKKIKMVDLHTQYLRHSEDIDYAIREVIHSTAFIKGPDVQLFQQELADYMMVDHCITCGNGTDALQIAMMALGLQPGDEVITTPFTFVATVEVISLLGLKPVFVDIDPGTFNLDASKLEQVLTNRTKAIVPVHLFGQAASMNSILKFARNNNLFVIEDNAQAIGATYRLADGSSGKAGALGDIGCTSFFPSKNLGAFGDGGALFTNDAALAQRIGSLVNHGMTRRYHYDHVGVNSRLDTIQAAILRVKLKFLDEYNAARQEVAKTYDTAFSKISGLKIPERDPGSEHIFHQYTLQVPGGQRDALKEFLNQQEIPAMIYYPVPLHLQKAYAELGYREGSFPVAEELSEKVLSLPIHTEMEDDQLETIISAVTNFFRQ